MKKKFSFYKLMNNDSAIRVMSVIVAIIVWLVVTISVYPNAYKTISDIPINFDMTNSVPEAYSLSIIEGMDKTVSVKVEGIRAKLVKLTKDDFIATPVFAQVNKAGDYKIQINISKVNSDDQDYKIISSSPKVEMKFDELVNKQFTLNASAENVMAPEGFIRDEAFVTPEIISLKGPLAEIEKIQKCVVTTTENITLEETATFPGVLTFLDNLNNPLTLKHTSFTDENYIITVPVSKLKTVPLTFNYINVPQSVDPNKLKYKMTVDEITIAGLSKTVDEITEISLGEIDYRMIDLGYAPTLQVEMPSGIVNVDNINSVTVEFEDENLSSSLFTIPKENILTRSLPSSYNIKIESTSINDVKIVGLADDIENLTAKDLIAYVDFSGKEITEGSSRQTVQIYVSTNKFAWAVGEYRVVVNATKKTTN